MSLLKAYYKLYYKITTSKFTTNSTCYYYTDFSNNST